jgi:hypothetical protein
MTEDGRSYIAATGEFGLVVRKQALADKGLELSTLLDAMDGVGLLGEDGRLLSFGPIFGADAIATLQGQLRALGLEHVDDFVELELLLPVWVQLGVAHV